MNSKKLFSLIMTFVMISVLSITAFAISEDGTYKLVGATSATEAVAVGDTFTYTLNFAEEGADSLVIDTNCCYWTITLNYDSSAFQLVGDPTLNYNFAKDSVGTSSGDGYYTLSLGNDTDYECTFVSATPLITYTFKVLETATPGEKAFSISDDADILAPETGISLIINENLIPAMSSVTVAGNDPDPVVVDATVEEITEDGWVWTDAKAYKLSATAEGDVSEVSCALKVSYTRISDSAVITDKVLDSINLAGVYVTEGSTISFKPIFKGTDAITGLSVKGTFTLK